MIEEIKWRVKTPKIAFKIETEEGLKNIEKIIPYCDVVIFERGTLAINTKFEKLGIYQKIIAKICNKHKKQMVVSTQILESTAENYIPQRGEILDITNMVLDGINGIMLCHETGIGDRPTYSISVAQKIISAVKEYRAIQKNES